VMARASNKRQDSAAQEAVNFLRTRENSETWYGTTITIEWKFLPATKSP
jgi:hypothetical protein